MAGQSRNEPCRCGSGKKYKHCCALKAERTPLGTRLMVLAVALMLLAGAVVMLRSLDRFATPATPSETILIR